MSQPIRFTRGKGFLEPWLARLRANQANRLVPNDLRNGRVLDIGCGKYPYFLSHTYFEEKFAIENSQISEKGKGINWFSLDLNQTPILPFEDEYFTAITLLAVIEHLNPTSLVKLFDECHRALSTDGVLIMTTPSAWTDGLLRFLAKISFVSEEEINEHVFTYTLPLIGWYFGKAGFKMTKIKFGYFEMMMNMWALAQK
jgi:SAM-dependent methyltransferase